MNNEGICTFDGKIWCFPLVTFEPTRRTSKNRVAGTLEMKPILSVTKDVMHAVIIEKLILQFEQNGQEKMLESQYTSNKIMHGRTSILQTHYFVKQLNKTDLILS